MGDGVNVKVGGEKVKVGDASVIPVTSMTTGVLDATTGSGVLVSAVVGGTPVMGTVLVGVIVD